MNLNNKPLKWVGVDDIHWKINNLLSKNKTMNFAISGRIPGKSTEVLRMLYSQFYNKDRKWMMFRRLQADMTSTAVEDVIKVINKFLPEEDRVKILYSKGDLSAGVCDVYVYPINQQISINNVDMDHLFFRVVALSIPLERIKGNILPNLEWMFFDEFCVSKKLGGKYLPYEAEKFGQIYRTFYRESKNLRCIFCGNPYSKYNPYTAWLNMNLQEIKVGNIYFGDNWAIEYISITPELKQWVLDHDAMMDLESEEQAMFSLEGKSIEDENTQLMPKQPENSRLLYLFKTQGKLIGVYKLPVTDLEFDCKYWIQKMPDNYNTTRKQIACFNAYELVSRVYMVSNQTKTRFASLLDAYRFWQICYKDYESAALAEEIFEYLI